MGGGLKTWKEWVRGCALDLWQEPRGEFPRPSGIGCPNPIGMIRKQECGANLTDIGVIGCYAEERVICRCPVCGTLYCRPKGNE